MAFINDHGHPFTETISYLMFEAKPSVIRLPGKVYKRHNEVPNFERINWQTSIVRCHEATPTTSASSTSTSQPSLVRREHQMVYHNSAFVTKLPALFLISMIPILMVI